VHIDKAAWSQGARKDGKFSRLKETLLHAPLQSPAFRTVWRPTNDDVEAQSATTRRDSSKHPVWCGLMHCCSAAPCTSAATFWHTPELLCEEISADYNDIVHAGSTKDIEARRKSFIRKWPLKCRAIAGSSPLTQLTDSRGARGWR
jgi:hypothetical protein